MEIHDVAIFLEDRGAVSKKTETGPPLTKGRLKSGELNLFARTLGGLLEGGVPILKALEGLETVAERGVFKRMLAELQENVRRGVGLSEALERSGVVPAFFYQTVYGGEVSGRVPMVLSELAKYLEKEDTLKRSVRDALVYPAFISAVGFVTLGVLTCFVLPKISTVYEGFGTTLPFITRLILGLSKFFLPMTAVLVLLVAYSIVTLRKQKWVAAKFLYKMPFIGDFFQGFIRVRFSRLLSLLLESGIAVLEALSVVEKTFEIPFLRQDVVSIKNSLAVGRGFSDCLDKVEWMDPVSRMLIVTGEETGRLSASFFQIARDTESNLEARIQLVVKLLEPVLILVMGLSVGFVVMGTVLPIFDMSSIIR